MDDDERKKAIKFLKNPEKWDMILKEMDRTYIGQDTGKMGMFIKFLQSYTPKYPQLQCVGATSAGKTSLTETVIDLFPDEDTEWITEFSKTVLRREEELLDKRIIVISQEEGVGNKYHMQMVSRDDTRGVALIFNNDKDDTEKMFLPKCTFISMNVNYFLEDSQNNTRTEKIFLDESVEQNNDAGDFISNNLSMDLELRTSLGEVSESIADLIVNSIRIYREEILKTNIPYARYIKENMDFSKQRAKRDLKSMAGGITAITNYNRYDRDVMVLGDIVRLIAEPEDFELYLKYLESHQTQTYYETPEKFTELVEMIKEMSEASWFTDGWISAKKIIESSNESRANIQKKLKKLAEEFPYIERGDTYEYDEKTGNKIKDTDGNVIKNRGYSYKFVVDVPDSLFNERFEKYKMQEAIDYYKEYLKSKGAVIMPYQKYIEI